MIPRKQSIGWLDARFANFVAERSIPGGIVECPPVWLYTLVIFDISRHEVLTAEDLQRSLLAIVRLVTEVPVSGPSGNVCLPFRTVPRA